MNRCNHGGRPDENSCGASLIMNANNAPETGPEERPLITPAMAVKFAAAIVLLACLTLALIVAGRWIGARMAMGGFTDSPEILDIFIGQDHLRLPANAVRTDTQRKTGPAEQIDLVLTWPELQGYSHENRNRFYDLTAAGGLIFVEVSQRTMTHDMAGRFDPIYRLLLQPQPSNGPAGLIQYNFRENSSYRGEALLVSPDEGSPSFAIRCILSADTEAASNTDCQYDTEAGQDLTIMTRYSKDLLTQWKDIDAAIKLYIKQHLAE
jgi:hypothetical protein